MSLTENGVSTTRGLGEFACETYRSASGKTLVQWDYRDRNGNLWSGISPSVESAKSMAAKHGYSAGQPNGLSAGNPPTKEELLMGNFPQCDLGRKER